MADFDKSNDCDIQYDEYLVECCKTWRDGGFVKAYRHWNKGKFSLHCNNKRAYTISIEGTRKRPITLAGIRDELEDLWIEMCDAWFDFSRTNDFWDNQDDDYDFDDEIDWLDVSHTLVNTDTIDSFID